MVPDCGKIAGHHAGENRRFVSHVAKERRPGNKARVVVGCGDMMIGCTVRASTHDAEVSGL